MKFLKSFEAFSKTVSINNDNFTEYKDKLFALIANEDNNETLKKGYEFVSNNIEDYDSDNMVYELSNMFFKSINNLIETKYPAFYKVEDKGYSGNKFTGKNYEKTSDLSIAEISKMIKTELAIEFPDWKFSVKSKSYTGGRSLNVYIEDMPYNPYSEYMDNRIKNNITGYDYERGGNVDEYIETYRKDYKKIEHIANQYNYDDSDVQSDYFSVNYYCFVTLEHDKIREKFYSDNEEVKKRQEREKQYAEEDRIRKEAYGKKKEEFKKKFTFKKGEECIYIHTNEQSYVPVGEYKAIILKAPSATAFNPSYEIRYYIDKKKVKGEIVDRDPVISDTRTIYSDTQLKKVV